MRGRKPKPAAIRELHNSKRRPYHRDEPQIGEAEVEQQRVTVPDAPSTLSRAERGYWNKFAPLLAGARLLTAADVETLGDYCRACQAVVDVMKERRRARSPQEWKTYDASLRGWLERKLKLAGELGLTAISRTRVGWSGHKQVLERKDKPKSALADLQERAAKLRKPVAVK